MHFLNIDKEQANKFNELLLIYFTNLPNNQFQDPTISIVPRWSKINKEDYDIWVQLLSKKIVKVSKENIRNYANLAWLHSTFPHCVNSYKMILQ